MPIYLIKRDGAFIGAVEDTEQMGPLAWFHRNCLAYSMGHALQHEGYSVETVEEIDCHDVAGMLEAIATRRGVSAEFAFVPFSLSRNASEDRPSLNWKVTIKGGRYHSKEPFTVDYMQGSGHCPADKRKWENAAVKARAVALECETGKIAAPRFYPEPRATARKIEPPAFGDVLHSLSLDSEAVEMTFSDWCADFGYSDDSIKAKATFDACNEIGKRLRWIFDGDQGLAELRLIARFN